MLFYDNITDAGFVFNSRERHDDVIHKSWHTLHTTECPFIMSL